MSDNMALIARLRQSRSPVEAFALNDEAAEALTKAERELTELGTAFRDYKIVHPEGTR